MLKLGRKLVVLSATIAGCAALAPAARAAFPGRNGVIAYRAPGPGLDGGPAELWTVNPASGATTPLTNLYSAWGPAWSDDGRTLAFSLFIGREGRVIAAVPGRRPAAAPWTFGDAEFMTLPAPPTSPDNPVPFADDEAPSWAPGGRRIVYAQMSHSIVVLGADDSKRVIATGTTPAWSPDGRLIAFSRCASEDTGCSLWIVRPNGTGLRRLTDGTMNERAPDWAPNGRRLVFQADTGLWTIRRRAFGRRPRQLTDSGVSPSWSPDGTQIAFGRDDGVYVVAKDGSNLHRLLATPDPVRDTAWQPRLWPMRMTLD
jgi:WD40-like Beta Propeller Repeat